VSAILPLGHLLDVQFWLMGRDVEHPDGNLLLRLGFTRERSPSPGLPSRYHRRDAEGPVVIWPCGLYLSTPDHDCLLVRGRPPAVVGDVDPGSMFDPAEVIAAMQRGRPCPPAALTQASRWLADYESAIAHTVGVAHRVPRAGSRPSLAPSRPCSLERAWHALATLFE